jgi:transcriptional regulator of arginine metabolism
MNKRMRQNMILEIISARQISTQQELAGELARAGIAATQSSVSRDIVELELAKVDGYYVAPETILTSAGAIRGIEKAGENLLVIKTEIGQAQPTALTIDGAGIAEIVGTVAGDDTILVAVKNEASQRIATKKILKLFSRPVRPPRLAAARASRSAGRVPSPR